MTDTQKRKKLKLLNFTAFVFAFSLVLTGTSKVLLKAHCNTLIEEKQNVERKITVYEILNDNIYKEIEEIDTAYRMNLDELLKTTKLQKNPDAITEIESDDMK